ncbi:sigma factor-like helix-turn-helix DNA-binding protein [Aquamicrobium lusatiense]|uniref:sigma factor-like helix-turn-helix DNA-binding protein n=1 Tax=Aquamicrobium lusatiense TaxID=89772 RepID=UPI00160CBBCB
MSSARVSDMLRRHESGETLQEIGSAYGLSRERVRQILKRAGAEMRGSGNGRRPGIANLSTTDFREKSAPIRRPMRKGLIPYAGKERA